MPIIFHWSDDKKRVETCRGGWKCDRNEDEELVKEIDERKGDRLLEKTKKIDQVVEEKETKWRWKAVNDDN